MAKITIYTTPSCHYCHAAKEYFKSKGLEWTEYDVSKDIPHQQEMIQRSGQMGVPVIDIDGNLIVGYDKVKIDQLLHL
jgi:glutaredoxin 3